MTNLELDIRLERTGHTLAVKTCLPLGGISVVFGPNGSGKSTLLRTIAGLETGATGRIILGDRIWQDTNANVFIPAHRRRIGLVFQDARLLSHLTVRDNLAYAAKRASGDGSALDDLMHRFELATLASKKPSALSGGERQRVAIARALATNPLLLVMDEPTSALDIRRRAQVLSLIEGIPKADGIPIVYVTHAIDEVVRLADHLAMMKDGLVAATGDPATLFARLDLSPMTGRFEASALITGTVGKTDNAYALTNIDIGGQNVTVPRLDLPAGKHVRLRIRARDVALALQPPKGLSIRNTIPATIGEIAPEPSTAFAEVTLATCGQTLRARLTRASLDELKLQPGKKVYALIKSIALDRRLLGKNRETRGENSN